MPEQRNESSAADIRADEPFGTVEGGVPLPESMKDMPLIDARDVSAAQPRELKAIVTKLVLDVLKVRGQIVVRRG